VSTTVTIPANDDDDERAPGRDEGVAQLRIHPWADPLVDRLGHDPRDAYVETFWLGILGPASIVLLRHLATRFDLEPDGFDLDLESTARALGLGTGLGKWGPMQRTLSRCTTFGMARRWGRDGLVVRRSLPPLARHQVARLPEHLQQYHAEWITWLDAQRRADAAADGTPDAA